MLLFDKFKRLFKSQKKPSSFPISNPVTDDKQFDEDTNRQLDLDKDNNEIVNFPFDGKPEDFSKNVNVPNPELDIYQQQNSDQDTTNFFFELDDKNNVDITSPNITEHQVNIPSVLEMSEEESLKQKRMNVKDIRALYSTVLADKMEKLGISWVEKEAFDKRYKELVKKAVKEKKPLSEYFSSL